MMAEEQQTRREIIDLSLVHIRLTRKRRIMQKWEYFEVTLIYGLINSKAGKAAWFPRRINGKDVLHEQGWDESAKTDGLRFINQLGEEGWELVSSSYPYPHDGGRDFVLMFKRPKE